MSSTKDIGYFRSFVSSLWRELHRVMIISRYCSISVLSSNLYSRVVGVSILVSGFFAILAFNASAVKKYWAERKKDKSPHRTRHALESRHVDKKSVSLKGSSGGDTIV